MVAILVRLAALAAIIFTSAIQGEAVECLEGHLVTGRGRGTEGFSPLWANVATEDQAKKVYEKMTDTEEFATVVKFPTASKSNPAFGRDVYWRGLVWLDQSYFGLKGMQNYGFDQSGTTVTDLFDHIMETPNFHENYLNDNEDPIVRGATNFGWAAAHALMMYWEMLTKTDSTAVSTLKASDFTNVIDRFGTPAYMWDKSGINQRFNPMFDLGSYHGFSLPEKDSKKTGFTGPMIIAEEYSLFFWKYVESLEGTMIKIGSEAETLLEFNAVTSKSHPGVLVQKIVHGDLIIEMELRFILQHFASIQTTFTNAGKSSDIVVNPKFTGEMMVNSRKKEDGTDVKIEDDKDKLGDLAKEWKNIKMTEESIGAESLASSSYDIEAPKVKLNFIQALYPKIRSTWSMMLSGSSKLIVMPFKHVRKVTKLDTTGYSATLDAPLTIKAGESAQLTTLIGYVNSDDDMNMATLQLLLLAGADGVMEEHVKEQIARWDNYVAKTVGGRVVQNKANEAKLSKYNDAAIRAVETLIGNWRSAGGMVKHDMLTPSNTAPYFDGAFGWDTMKMAVAMAKIDPEVAMNSVRAMFDSQIEKSDPIRPQDVGMIVDAVFYNSAQGRKNADGSEGDGGNWNERNTKPPLSAWAVWSIYEALEAQEASSGKSWLNEMFPKLQAHLHWWKWNRRVRGLGGVVPRFGATLSDGLHNDGQDPIFHVTVKPNTEAYKAVSTMQCSKSESAAGDVYQCSGIENYDAVMDTPDYVKMYLPIQEAIGWDSGMDNAGRFGFITPEQLAKLAEKVGGLEKAKALYRMKFDSVIRYGEPLAFVMAQESVDLASFYYVEVSLMAKIATALNLNNVASDLESESKTIQEYIQKCFYDPTSGFFYDRQVVQSTGEEPEDEDDYSPSPAVSTRFISTNVVGACLVSALFYVFM